MKGTIHSTGAVFLAVVIWAGCAPAQPPERPSFDAASVKPAQFIPGQSHSTRGGPGTSDPGRITWTRVSMLDILMRAYGVQFDRISGPKWISDNANLFDVIATMPRDTSQDRFQQMLQSLLVARFHLKLQRETKIFPGHELTIAKAGSKLKESSLAPDADSAGRGGVRMNREGMLAVQRPGLNTAYLNDGERMACGACTMEQFAATLGSFVNMAKDAARGSPIPVISDKTGLSGKYDIAMSFACLGTACGGGRVPPSALTNPLPPAPASDPVNLPTLFIALEKQLGLTLEKAKDVPVEILVVDGADMQPTEN